MRTLLSVYITSRSSSSSSKPYLGLWTPDSVCLSPTLLVPTSLSRALANLHYPNCLSQRVCNYLLPYLLDTVPAQVLNAAAHQYSFSSFFSSTHSSLPSRLHSFLPEVRPGSPPRLFQARVRILSDIELNPPSDRF